MTNLILDTDSYKASHYLQYPPDTTNVFNYLESRGGEYKETVFFGLQYLLEKYLSQTVKLSDVYEAAAFFKAHGVPFNLDGWARIAVDLDGKIPLRIKALPEGTVTPTGIPLLTCEATDPQSFWVVGWFETMVMRLWYPITVATLSHNVKKTIRKYLGITADDLSGLDFKLHDFGARGVSSRESAAIGGAAHLVSFKGSDTIAGVLMANEVYGAEMAGFSIPAAEHSTITAWGKDGELDAYRNMLAQFARPGSLVAVVSDSYDIYRAVESLWGGALREEVIDSGATVVIRPDSGDPVVVVNKVLHSLERRFGSTTNSKGFRVLNNVRVIQGDGVNPYTIDRILESARLAGFSADNIAFGMGGALLQQVNRDTQRFAFKCSSVTVGGVERDVFKSPVDDPGKQSKRGRLGARLDHGTWVVCLEGDRDNALTPVFENGQILRTETFEAIRARVSR